MKTSRLILLVVVASISFTMEVFADSITVTAPNTPDMHLVQGATQTITWTYSGKWTGKRIQIVLLQGGVPLGEIVPRSAAIPLRSAMGSYSWQVGQSTGRPIATPGAGYRIQIRVVGTRIADASDHDFSIVSDVRRATSGVPAAAQKPLTSRRTRGTTEDAPPSADELKAQFMRLGVQDPDATDTDSEHPGNVVMSPQTAILTWQELISTWDFFRTAFSVHLNNRGSGSAYLNNSYVEIHGHRHSLPLPLVQYDKNALHHRCLIYNMNAPVDKGVMLTKKDCGINQLRIIVPFEGDGVEIKRFNKSLSVLQKKWCDGCEADRDLINPVLEILLTFHDDNKLDCSVEVKFKAGVKESSGAVAEAAITVLTGGLNQIVGASTSGINDYYQRVFDSIGEATKVLLHGADKNHMLNSLASHIRLKTGLTHGEQITKYEFKNDGIHIVYVPVHE